MKPVEHSHAALGRYQDDKQRALVGAASAAKLVETTMRKGLSEAKSQKPEARSQKRPHPPFGHLPPQAGEGKERARARAETEAEAKPKPKAKAKPSLKTPAKSSGKKPRR